MKKSLIYLAILFFYNNNFSQCFTSISCGSHHVTAKKSDNTFWAWGSGGAGQLGNSTGFDESSPLLIPNSNNGQTTYAGGGGGFLIKTNGTL
jgi:alpha-tubulin suppressor-like RCC1 family protein